MRVAIDLRPLQSGHRFRGIGKYIANVVPELIRSFSDDSFVCYHYGETPPDLDYANNVEFVSTGAYDPSSFGSKLYRKLFMHQPGIEKIDNCDVLFQPDIGFGLSKQAPTVTTLYDLIPIIYNQVYFASRRRPFFMRPLFLARRNQVFKQFMRLNERFTKADGIVSISKASIRDLHKIFPNSKSVPYSITPLAAQELPAPRTKKIHARPFMLYVGGTDARKNLKKLVDMFATAVADGLDMDLLLIGHDFKQVGFFDTAKLLQHIEASPAKSHIKIIGYADDQDLATYYAQARALLFASEYEGFGMPILEAMQAGCPVVCFNNSSIPEVAGKAAIMVKTEAEFVQGMKRLADSEQLRKDLVRKGHQQAQHFSWQITARETYRALQKACADSRDS